MRKRKVLFFADGLYGGGAEKVLQTLLKYLNKDLFEITLYSVKEETLDDLYPNDIVYRYIFYRWNSEESFWKRLRKRVVNKFKLLIYYHLSPTIFYSLFVKGKYDVEVAFIEGYATRIVSGSTNKKSKKIAWIHTNLEKNHWTAIAFQNVKEEQNAYTKFVQVISVSQSVQVITEKLFKDIHNSITLYNPIDADNIVKLSSQIVPFNKSSEKIRIISVGRYVQQKAFHRLISITAQLVTAGYDIELWLIGEGEQRPLLEKQIANLKLKDRVFLTGFQNNPYPYIKNADLFVCSSLIEGYSTVVTEALILGIPIVTTDCAGMSELLENGQYGLITENSEESLYQGIKYILDNPHLLEYYRSKIKDKSKDFAVANLMRPIEELLQNN